MQQKSVRAAILCFAGVLCALGLWMLSPQLMQPALPFFPVTPEEKNIFSRHSSAIAVAAYLGFPRGDLWVDYAFSQTTESEAPGTASQGTIEQAQATASRAAQLAPYDTRIWLLLAQLNAQLSRPDRELTQPLKMSFLTGPYQMAIMPARVALATETNAIEDSDIQEFVEHDLRIAARSRKNSPWIISAYRHASLNGKALIEKTLTEIDPGLLSAIR